MKDRKETKLMYYFKTDQGQIPFYSWLAVSYDKFQFLKSILIK